MAGLEEQSIVPDTFEQDSAFEEPLESVESLRSSILDYHKENGRTYHALSAGKYVLPNDEAENERLDVMNHLFFITLGDRQCLCPKDDGAKRVLDLGTGTGTWAIDYADAHPEAEVTGVDLSPIQPSFVPPNCKFEIDDLEKEWTWSKPFDFIYARSMTGSFTSWPAIIEKAYNALEPGGYLEMLDCAFPVCCDDGTMKEDAPILRWTQLLAEAADKLGRSLTMVTKYKDMMEAAGFEEVTEKTYKWPTNRWAKEKKFKELGAFALTAIDSNLEGLSLALFTRGLGWTKEETILFCAKVRKDMRNPNIHAYWVNYVVYGRKPKISSSTAAA